MLEKNALYLSVDVFSTKVLTGDTIFSSSSGDVTRPLSYMVTRATRRSSRLKGSLIKSLSTGIGINTAPGIEPDDLPLCSLPSALPTKLVLPPLNSEKVH